MHEFAGRLIGQRHYESAEIREREQAVLQRRVKSRRLQLRGGPNFRTAGS